MNTSDMSGICYTCNKISRRTVPPRSASPNCLPPANIGNYSLLIPIPLLEYGTLKNANNELLHYINIASRSIKGDTTRDRQWEFAYNQQ